MVHIFFLCHSLLAIQRLRALGKNSICNTPEKLFYIETFFLKEIPQGASSDIFLNIKYVYVEDI